MEKCDDGTFESGRECATSCAAPLVAGLGKTCVPSGAEECAGFFDRASGACVADCALLNRAEWTCEAEASCSIITEAQRVLPIYAAGRVCIDSCASPAVMRADRKTCTSACANGEFPDAGGMCEFGCALASWEGARGHTCVKKCAGITIPGVLGPKTTARLCAEVPVGTDPGAVCAAVG